jgi:hypothetical protein
LASRKASGWSDVGLSAGATWQLKNGTLAGSVFHFGITQKYWIPACTGMTAISNLTWSGQYLLAAKKARLTQAG